MKKYFGTDGIRGVYGEGLDCETAFLLGAAIGKAFGGDCVVGMDTRLSGGALFEALAAGLNASGARALCVGVLPTPAVSFLVDRWDLNFGVMITASHNPPSYNGLKVFARGGLKLSEGQESEIEKLMEFERKRGNSYIGWLKKNKGLNVLHQMALDEAKALYIQELIDEFNEGAFCGLKVLLDSGHGAAGAVAGEVFLKLGASVKSINDGGDGEWINANCGTEHIKGLLDREDIAEFDLAFAFDGDADRTCVIVGGKILDGDSLLYSLSKSVHLKDGVVLGTLMSNSALERKLKSEQKELVRVPVGDKYILDAMVKSGYSLGGEQSGHYIFYPKRKTGDGILTALMVCVAFMRGELEFLELLPQRTVSLKAERALLDDERVRQWIDGTSGKVESLLVRMSGTEPKVRISVEDEDEAVVDAVVSEFLELIRGI